MIHLDEYPKNRNWLQEPAKGRGGADVEGGTLSIAPSTVSE
jgi:hypothetical protein